MSDLSDRGAPAPAKEDPGTLVLRGRPQPVVRFRRAVIVGAAGAVTALLVTVSWFALEPRSHAGVTTIDSDEPAGKPSMDTLAGVPASYRDVPRLGPPLPGDLGQPVLEQERSDAEASATGLQAAASADEDPIRHAAEARQQRLEAELQAARSSPVIVRLARSDGPSASPAAADAEGEDGTGTRQVDSSDAPQPAALHAPGDPASGAEADRRHLSGPASPWTLAAGTMIPASLLTGLDSDVPGIVVAQVTENVRDSATGRTILVPQGARLIGRYESKLTRGQRRALVMWTRIVLPDGSSIQLDDMPATDLSGFAGLQDRVDSHGFQLLKGIVLSTLLGVGTQLGIGGGGSELVRAIRQSGTQNASDAGSQITSRNLDVQPTIRVRPGWPVRAIVNRDLQLRPWRG